MEWVFQRLDVVKRGTLGKVDHAWGYCPNCKTHDFLVCNINDELAQDWCCQTCHKVIIHRGNEL